MKRLPAILFAIVLLFNFYGYRLMLDCLQDSRQQAFTARVDRNNYNEEDLISIKTPMDLPYYTNSEDYERTYGSINVQGVDYEYVKRRVYHDTLEVLCLPNRARTEIQDARNEFFKHNLDGTASNKKSNRIVRISLPDYCQELRSTETVRTAARRQSFGHCTTVFSSADYSLRQERPPRSIYASARNV